MREKSGKAVAVPRKLWYIQGQNTHGVDENQAVAYAISRGRHHQKKMEEEHKGDFLRA